MSAEGKSVDRIRRRMAVGVFATAGEIEPVVERLSAVGINRRECFVLSADQVSSTLALPGAHPEATTLVGNQAVPAGHIMLRVYLATMAEEQLVAGVLLASTASSVQLHDVDAQTAVPRFLSASIFQS